MAPKVADLGSVTEFNLDSEIAALDSRKPWPQGLTSRMLVKSDDLRILLIAMEAGARMKEHHSDGRISVHVLRGAIRIRIENQTRELSAKQLLVVDRSIKHDVEALEASVFMLTIAWPSDQDLIGMKHRGYGS
jgi:quercetin dioxygenase-like cupin family protein